MKLNRQHVNTISSLRDMIRKLEQDLETSRENVEDGRRVSRDNMCSIMHVKCQCHCLGRISICTCRILCNDHRFMNVYTVLPDSLTKFSLDTDRSKSIITMKPQRLLRLLGLDSRSLC